MISPRWHKIFRDLWLNLPRTILVTLAIAVGIFGVGLVLNTYSILKREISTNYDQSNPPSATLWMDKTDDRALETAKNFPEVENVDVSRNPVRSRVQVGPNEWDVLLLYVAEDFNNLQVGKFFPQSGSWPPGKGQILIERSSLPVLHAEEGKDITMRLVGGDTHQVKVAGTVYDPIPDPAWVNNIASGYISPETLKWLGGTPPPNALRITLKEKTQDRAYIRNVAEQLSARLTKDGYKVGRIEVPEPGKYPQTDKVNSILLTLEAFGVLCLLLSGFITASLISSLMSQQIRQIGVMKALGASTRQTMGIYFGMILIMSLAALAVSVPLGIAAGKTFSFSTLDMLNFNVTSRSVPYWSILVQAALGILVPMLTALYPILKGSRVTVREAIRDYGISGKSSGTGRSGSLLKHIGSLPRPLALPLRNSFRRRGRMVLTLIMLTVGGATFMASLGSAASWNKTIDNTFSNIRYDLDIRFGKAYPVSAIEDCIRNVPGVKDVEAWGYAMSSAFPKFSDGTYGTSYAVFAPKNSSPLITPKVIKGRWLRPDDTNAIVLDTEFVDNAEKLGTPVDVGENLVLNLGGKDTQWRVVGIMDKIGLQSAAYTNYDYFAGVANQKGMAMCAQVVGQSHDKESQKALSRAVEQKLAEGGFSVFATQGLSTSRQVVSNHVVLILVLLMAMSLMVAVIGALGLASTMSVNVMERTREIGIMRSIGATSGTILKAVILEGVVIGLLSWILGTALAVPVTSLIARNTGQFIFPHLMTIVFPIKAPVIWLVLIVVIAIAASAYPARRATQLTVREVLNYE